MNFDGVNDVVDFNTSNYPSGNSTFTISALVNMPSIPTNVQYFVSFGGGSVYGDNFALGMYGSSGLFATFTGGHFDVISNVTGFQPYDWYFVTAVHKQNGLVELMLMEIYYILKQFLLQT